MSDDRSQPETAGEVQFDTASVVYDGKTGKIMLVHQMAALSGGKQLSPEEVDREALRLAEVLGFKGRLKALTVAPADLASGEVRTVNLKRLTLVPAKPARRKQAGSGKPKR